MKTPMILIAGPLGSGKTTLLRRLIDSTDLKTAVLMNEFGEIAVDSRVIKGKHIEVVELLGGCVCCSLIGAFEAAVEEIMSTHNPDLLIAETSGVAEPDSVVFGVEEGLPDVRLDSVVAVADVDGMVRFPDLGFATRLQFETADLILVNKIDLATDADTTQVESRLDEINSIAQKFRTVRCEIDPRLLLGTEEGHRSRTRKVVKAHDRVSEVQSFSYTSAGRVDLEKFEAVVDGLLPDIYRAKGFLRCQNRGLMFNFVAGRWELEPFPAERTELVFIGRNADQVQASVQREIRACEI